MISTMMMNAMTKPAAALSRLAAAAVMAAALGGLSAQAAPKTEAPAPVFAATDTQGAAVDLAALKGKTVVLEWTNHDCPFVRKHYGARNMQTLQRQAAEDGVVWISIISSAPGLQGHVDAATAERLNAERGASPAHVVLDPQGEIGRLYGAATTPHMYVIDPEGVLAYRGAIDDIPSASEGDIEIATNYVTAALDALAKGERPEVQTSRPYGCSVKYGS